MLTVRRTALGYLAEATPPHVERRWSNVLPMGKQALVRELCERGAHVQDAWDAVLEAERSPTGVGQV